MPIDDELARRLHRKADGERWRVSGARLAEALAASASRAFASRAPEPRALEQYLSSLHLTDLALACACADGDDAAWEHFVREQRPGLYRAAAALAPGGEARDLADALYAELFGLRERDGVRQSLLRHFHGRSSLGTWLRAVLAQRHVDRLRAARRLDPLPDDESPAALPASSQSPDPERDRSLALIRPALARAIAALPSRDRLRLTCYYAQALTLKETGRLTRESEATVSRQLARTRTAIRHDVERTLRDEARLSEAQIARCFEVIVEDAGPVDLGELLGAESPRKESGGPRSNSKERT